MCTCVDIRNAHVLLLTFINGYSILSLFGKENSEYFQDIFNIAFSKFKLGPRGSYLYAKGIPVRTASTVSLGKKGKKCLRKDN